MLTQYLREEPFKYSLGLQQPNNLVEMLELADSHLNAEKNNKVSQSRLVFSTHS